MPSARPFQINRSQVIISRMFADKIAALQTTPSRHGNYEVFVKEGQYWGKPVDPAILGDSNALDEAVEAAGEKNRRQMHEQFDPIAATIAAYEQVVLKEETLEILFAGFAKDRPPPIKVAEIPFLALREAQVAHSDGMTKFLENYGPIGALIEAFL